MVLEPGLGCWPCVLQKQREQKYLDPLEQPHHFSVPPHARDGSKVLAAHISVACSRSPCFKCKGGREVMIRDTLK